MEKKILIVDDDKIVLESCRRILESERFEVVLVSSAIDAIKQLDKCSFDLILMDVKMPEKDGVYLLKKIREKWPLDDYKELPVLVMSGYPTPDTIHDLKKQGARDFIPKPFTPDELLLSVQKSIKRGEHNG